MEKGEKSLEETEDANLQSFTSYVVCFWIADFEDALFRAFRLRLLERAWQDDGTISSQAESCRHPKKLMIENNGHKVSNFSMDNLYLVDILNCYSLCDFCVIFS